MANDLNFILGRGERLTHPVPYPRRGNGVPFAYSWRQQQQFLPARIKGLLEDSVSIPVEAMPDGQFVSTITLHPSHISRSAFPEILVRHAGFRLLGTRPMLIRPRAGKGSDSEEGVFTTSLYVAGDEQNWSYLYEFYSDDDPKNDDRKIDEARRIENVDLLTSVDRIHVTDPNAALEVVLHFDPTVDNWQDDVEAFASKNGIQLVTELSYFSQGLWFVPARLNDGNLSEFAEFSFIRSIREQERLRPVSHNPTIVRAVETKAPSVKLPEIPEKFPDATVAVFDGGMLQHSDLPWVTEYKFDDLFGIGESVASFQEHGHAVTSALLFGHVDDSPELPFCQVDHYRVLGDSLAASDMAIPQIHQAIDAVLRERNYDFIVLCLGPEQVVNDGAVSKFALMLDEHTADGETLLMLAPGNNGDKPAPESRVLVPSDAVNALAVGACTSLTEQWDRAFYSPVGPGRHPGKVKPDVLNFGGIPENMFRFVFPEGRVFEDCGTSYSTPATMRLATAVRTSYGEGIKALGLRALLINTAQREDREKDHVGWGRVTNSIAEIMSCSDSTVRVVFQDQIEPGRVVRHPVPLPSRKLKGKTKIRATFCFACPTDGSAPGDYTRGALDPVFRPNKDKFEHDKDGKPKAPKSKSFFRTHDFADERDLRASAGKWETVLHDEHNFNPSTLNEPVFDVHYVARELGYSSGPSSAEKLRYALVLTVSCPKDANLYADVVTRYEHELEAFAPIVEVDVSAGQTG